MTTSYDLANHTIGFDFVPGQGWEAFAEDEKILIGGRAFPSLTEALDAVGRFLAERSGQPWVDRAATLQATQDAAAEIGLALLRSDEMPDEVADGLRAARASLSTAIGDLDTDQT